MAETKNLAPEPKIGMKVIGDDGNVWNIQAVDSAGNVSLTRERTDAEKVIQQNAAALFASIDKKNWDQFIGSDRIVGT